MTPQPVKVGPWRRQWLDLDEKYTFLNFSLRLEPLAPLMARCVYFDNPKISET